MSSGSRREVLSSRALSNVCESSLVATAKCGDALAFDELCNRNWKMVYCASFRITRNVEDTEDVIQEAFLRAYVHINSFDGRSAFSTWLTRIAINSALMLLRRGRRARVMSFDDLGESHTSIPLEFVEPSLNPEQQLIDLERRLMMRNAVRKLPDRLRRVIEIRHAADCSIEEVAATAGISVAATKSRLLRARNLLSRPLKRANQR